MRGTREQNEIKIFIFTHLSIDFHNIGYGFPNKKIKRWRISKNMDGNSEIELIKGTENKNYSDYYKSVMIELIDLAKISKNKLNVQRNFLAYDNKRRFIIESHARSHYNIENTTSSQIDEIMKYYSIGGSDKEETINALDIINTLSHGMSIPDHAPQQVSVQEVQWSVITLLRILYRKNKHHLDAI